MEYQMQNPEGVMEEDPYSPYHGLTIEEQDEEYQRQLIEYEVKKREFEENRARIEALQVAKDVEMSGGSAEEQHRAYETAYLRALDEVADQTARYEADAGYEPPVELLNQLNQVSGFSERRMPTFNDTAVSQQGSLERISEQHLSGEGLQSARNEESRSINYGTVSSAVPVLSHQQNSYVSQPYVEPAHVYSTGGIVSPEGAFTTSYPATATYVEGGHRAASPVTYAGVSPAPVYHVSPGSTTNTSHKTRNISVSNYTSVPQLSAGGHFDTTGSPLSHGHTNYSYTERSNGIGTNADNLHKYKQAVTQAGGGGTYHVPTVYQAPTYVSSQTAHTTVPIAKANNNHPVLVSNAQQHFSASGALHNPVKHSDPLSSVQHHTSTLPVKVNTLPNATHVTSSYDSSPKTYNLGERTYVGSRSPQSSISTHHAPLAHVQPHHQYNSSTVLTHPVTPTIPHNSTPVSYSTNTPVTTYTQNTGRSYNTPVTYTVDQGIQQVTHKVVNQAPVHAPVLSQSYSHHQLNQGYSDSTRQYAALTGDVVANTGTDNRIPLYNIPVTSGISLEQQPIVSNQRGSRNRSNRSKKSQRSMAGSQSCRSEKDTLASRNVSKYRSEHMGTTHSLNEYTPIKTKKKKGCCSRA